MHFLTDALHGNIRELTGNGYDRCRRTFSTFQQFARALQLCGCKIEDHRATARFGRGLNTLVHCCTLVCARGVPTSETHTYLFYYLPLEGRRTQRKLLTRSTTQSSPWRKPGRNAMRSVGKTLSDLLRSPSQAACTGSAASSSPASTSLAPRRATVASRAGEARQHGQSAVLAVPQLGSCASSGRAWRLWAARHAQEEAGPLGARPLPSVLEPAASEAAHFTAFDHVGADGAEGVRRGGQA